MANLSELREVRDRYIDKTEPPASTLLQVSGFFRPDILFEIEAVAVLPA
jgi:enamine deaminase RidA (YjgF/YER057c/UK114 family)